MSDVDLLDWSAPGPYRVAFSTRVGGVVTVISAASLIQAFP